MKSTSKIFRTLFGWGLVLLVVFITAVSNVATQTSLPVSSGLRLWLRSDMGITLDGSGKVQTWADQSGSGNDFIQNSANARPTLTAGSGPGGTDVLHFDGVDDLLSSPAQIVAGRSVTIFTVMAVREPGYPWVLGESYSCDNRDGLPRRLFYEGHPVGGVDSPDFFDVCHDCWNDARASFPGINDTRFKVLTITGSDRIHNVRVFVDGAAAVMTPQTINTELTFSPGNVLGFVHSTENAYTEVDFAEFIVYDRELNQTERELVEAYLISRYRTSCDSLSFSGASGSPFAAGTSPSSVAVGDFNGDGKLDLTTANFVSNTVTVLLGNGSGGFSPASGSPFAVGTLPLSVVVGHFNSDGKLDLATANTNSNNVTVLLGNGSGSFSAATGSPFAVGTNPHSVAVGDFNGDGKLDLATANNGSSNVTVLLGNGSGSFSPASASPFAVGASPYSVAVGDFNSDGTLDLTTANFNSNNVTVLLGNGSGGFSAATGSPFAVGTGPIPVAVGDFNGDGKLDLTTANFNSNNVTVLLGDGSGSFSPATGSPFAVGDGVPPDPVNGIGTYPRSLAVGDLNGDGKQDLATANQNSNNVTVLLGDGSGGFSPASSSPFAVGSGPESVAVGDFNGDGKLDLTTANNGSNNVTVLLNTCTSNTAPTISAVGVTRQQGSPSANAIIANVSDLEDLETVLTVTINGGGGATLNGVTVSGISVSAAGVVTADVIADFTATSASFTLRVTDTFGLFNEAALTITVNSNTAPTLGTYPDTSVIAGGNTTVMPDAAPTSAASINVSTTSAFKGTFAASPMTGVVMVINAHPAGTYIVTVTAFNSVGVTTTKTFTLTVTNPTQCDYPSFSDSSGFPFLVGLHPFSVVGDFNGDGKQDLATASDASNSVTVLLGNGSGGFSWASGSVFAVGSGPFSVAVGDFNGDGKLDLATANNGSSNVTVLLGNGSGGFSPATGSPFTVGSNPYSVAVGDFNGDGKLDLTTANYEFSNVTVLLGNGSGGFSEAGGSPFAIVGSGPLSVAVGDFNGDGKLDLTTANQGSNNATVLLGNGSGGFSAVTGSPFAVGTGPRSVAVGDFNGDGKLDLMTANSSSNNVTVLLGNGSGGFSAASGSPYTVGTNPFSVAVGDFNGDGKLDLTTANVNSDNVTVLLGNGSGGFSPARGSPFGGRLGPYSVAVGDFNGDGRQDLTTANIYSSNVAVRLNTCTQNIARWGQTPIFSNIPDISGPTGYVTGDLNGDGRLDLVAVGHGNNSPCRLLVLKQNASGNYDGISQEPMGANEGLCNGRDALALGDVDGDGDLDLIAQGTDNTSTPRLLLFLNDGTGTLAQQPDIFGPGLFQGAVALGDLNGDGDLDLAASGQDGNGAERFLIFNNNGVGGLTLTQQPRGVNTGYFHGSSLVFGDTDSDGDLDIVISGGGNSGRSLHVYKNTAEQLSLDQQLVVGPEGLNNSLLRLADLDRDGDLDLIAAGNNFDGVHERVRLVTFQNQGQGFSNGFTTLQELTGGTWAGLAVGDCNGDGYPDVFANGHDGFNFRLFYFQSQSGTLVEAEQPQVSFVGPIVFGDFDSDNDLDMVGLPVRSLYTNLLGPANAAPGIPSGLTATAGPTGLNPVGDLAAFGLAGTVSEMVTLTWAAPSDAESGSSALSYEVRLGTAPGQYNRISGAYGTPLMGTYPLSRLSAGQPGRRLKLGAGTHYWQVRAIDTGLRAGGWSAESSFVVQPSLPPTLGNYPDTTVQAGANTTVTPDAAPTNTASMNVSTASVFKGTFVASPTTGVVQVTNAHPAGTYSVTVTAFNSAGVTATKNFTLTVTNATHCDLLSFSGATGSPFAAGSYPNSVAVGDFNGDGTQDLATANLVSDNVTVLLGNGSGGFSAASGSPFAVLGLGPIFVAVGDFNGDGKLDLTTANYFSNDVTVLLGDDSGGFTPASGSPFVAGTKPPSVAVGDFNGDGKLDLATANIDSNDVTVLLGDGSGSFIPATGSPFAVGLNPWSVAVGDFNNDRKLDLTTANLNSGNVTVLLGNGSGGFSAASGSPFAIGTSPYSVAVGDFNGDGKLDLTTANQVSDNVTVLLGDGSGGFSAASGSPFAVGSGPYSVAVGDFNGDGKQDLATPNVSSRNVTVLLGDGSGGFSLAAASPFAVGSSPHSVAVGNFNGDGKLDLTTANAGSNNVTVLLNTCTANTASTISTVGPANVWIGLRNSDDVGTRFDVLAEVLKNGDPIGSGQINGVNGGSSGFNNAVLRTINLALSSPVNLSAGDTLSIRLSVRIAVGVSGHRSGTARLWFNDAPANSRFGATIGGTTNVYFLLDGFTLGTLAGPGPKKTIDVFVDRLVGGNSFKPFGTWSKTF